MLFEHFPELTGNWETDRELLLKYSAPEVVNHPDHYGGEEDPYEAIKVIEAWDLNFALGNVIKYVCRAGKKSRTAAVEDLKKARWYIDRQIELLQ